MMTFHYGPFLGHGHRDKMGITLFANQKLWLADYGTPGYGSAILPWYQSTLAHNAMVVDGKGQAATKENSVKLWLGGADLEAVESGTAEAYPGVTHTRTVVRVGEYFVVVDRLKSADGAHLRFLSAFGRQAGAGRRDSEAAAAGCAGPVDRGALPRWRLGRRCRAVGRKSGSGVGFWLGGSGPVTPIVGKCPAETGSRKVSLLIGRQKGREAEFVAVLCPCQGKLELAVARRGNQINIRQGRSSEVLTLPAEGACPSVVRTER